MSTSVAPENEHAFAADSATSSSKRVPPFAAVLVVAGRGLGRRVRVMVLPS
ncbi:MAG: hypothetical protein ACK5MT_18645 [Actinomycetales bacterium]